MLVRHIVLKLIGASGNKIESKTKIHKEMYFLSKLMQKDFGFRAHYYGPYSPQVDEALDELFGAGFLVVNANRYGMDYDRGFEKIRYDYVLTASGEKLLVELEEKAAMPSQIADFVQKLKDIGDPDYLDLSIAAKVLFLRDSKDIRLSVDEIKKEARELGWRLREEDIEKATQILRELGFIPRLRTTKKANRN